MVDENSENKGPISTNVQQYQQNGRHEPSQLDRKQHHAWFNDYEYDTSKYTPALGGACTINLPEYLNNLEQD